MRAPSRILVGAALVAFVGAISPARAATIERVVAVIGEHAIFMSDMRLRARPFLLQIQQQVPTGAQQAAAESELYKQLLQRMVDERIEQQAADRAHLRVTSEEIDAGLRNIASQQDLTVDQLVTEAHKTGLTTQEYREEIRRQILEGKLLQLRVRGRVRVTEEDVKVAYARLVTTERKRLSFRVSWVVLRVPPDASPAVRASRDQLAEQVAYTARAGVDVRGRPVLFAQLAQSFSDDTPTRTVGGDLGMRKPGELASTVEDEAMKLEVGQVSAPFHYKDAIVILKVTEREASALPPLEQAHDRVMQQAYSEQMDKARKQWLDEQRRALYVDIRL